MACLGAAVLCCMALPVHSREYASTAPGMGGEVSLTLVCEEGEIREARIEGESFAIGQAACRVLSERIVAGQTPLVDAVAGATITSQGILAAAGEAYEAAREKEGEFLRADICGKERGR